MKIAIMGCGAMGSVYAGLLARAGHDVIAISRSAEHVDAIHRDGLQLSGPLGEHSVPMRAYRHAPDESVDLVILAVKAADVKRAATQSLPMLGEQTVMLTIQNGLGAADTVASVVGADRLIVGIASGFGASLQGPGKAHHNAMQAMRFGAYAGLPAKRVEDVAEAWRSAGFDVQAVEDIKAMQWEKLICNVAYSAPCALTGMTVGEVMDDPEMGPVSRAAAVEAWTVAKALGIRITAADPVALVREFGARMPHAKPSALQDHEARRCSEIDVINGAVPRQAASVGVKTPVNSTLVSLVKARERQWQR
ncbi:ketopantoate reductase family protein [Diaphorobacter aerolatus]|uniref:2-dehydropantoate 2-reductase n=1 Tax=Diaphorobacter aerolatus TaxID=1288495 RepID=A0A7H0GL26_9BURK|nr:2-dehydropantoate 2-reductase [Diaphorobacter aerolatus]QNP48992.1 2-dehydropantoate 2-reductase [Diaphorobacter aerolatus]